MTSNAKNGYAMRVGRSAHIGRVVHMGSGGYIFTLSTFFMLSSVLMLALFFASQSVDLDITGPKLSHLFDDIRTDIVALSEVSLSISNDGNLTFVSFNERIPSLYAKPNLDNYQSFIEANYTARVGRSIENRRGSLAGADILLNLDRFALEIVPHAYAYTYKDLSKRELWVYPQANSSLLLSFDIDLEIDDDNVSVITDISPGDLPVKISVEYSNMTYNDTFLVSRNSTSTLNFSTPRGSVLLTLGNISMGSDFANSSLSLVTGGPYVNSDVSLTFNRTSLVTVESTYSAQIKDILGKATLDRRIWFAKE